jgi:hypothetical protein
MTQLEPADYLAGPRKGWSYHRGRWSSAYEGIRTVERQRGPFALWNRSLATNSIIEACMILDRDAEFASILLRASLEGDEQRGYEVCFDPRQQRVTVLRHGKDLTSLAVANALIPSGQPLVIKIELRGRSIRLWLNGDPKAILDATDPDPFTGPGKLGVRAWGAALSVDDMVVSNDGLRLKIEPEDGQDAALQRAERQAVQSFCLLLFNLNEMIYVD